MHITNEITVVLKAREGESIAALAPFLKTGCTVLVGRSGAVVSAVSAGDKITHAEQLENQVLLAESAMRRGVQLPASVEEFGAMHIDERIRMGVNAKRYEWLRDRTRVEDMDTDLCAAREEKCFFGAELDTEIDNGMRLSILERMPPCAD